MPWRCFLSAIDWLGRPPADLIVPVSPDHLLRLIDSLPAGTLNNARQDDADVTYWHSGSDRARGHVYHRGVHLARKVT
jgi:hypothetical protein